MFTRGGGCRGPVVGGAGRVVGKEELGFRKGAPEHFTSTRTANTNTSKLAVRDTMELTHCHTIGASDSFLSRLQGALAFTVVWGLGQFVGPLSPLLLVVAAFYLPSWLVLVLVASVAYPFLVPNE